jgi:diguanylate cyclase (GGDEF)-like protein
VNYLDVCARSTVAGCADAAEVASGLRSVFAGQVIESVFEYACPSPAVGRWFILRMTVMTSPVRCVLVTHMNITRRKRAEQDLERRASQDPLTGLSNRAQFARRLAHALTSRPSRSGLPDVGVLYLDLDGFKPVNDTYGHGAGDEVLQTVAARLRQATRPNDTVARLGGDEFAVVAPRISANDLAGLIERIRQVLNEPFSVHGDPIHVGVSVGSYLAASGENPDDCVHRADQDMYAAKRLARLNV